MDNQWHLDLTQWAQYALELSGRPLPPVAWRSIAEGLESTDVVRYLGLRKAGLGDDGVRVVMAGLRLNRSVEILDLEENDITDRGAADIAEMLRHNQSLQSLVLSRNKIRRAGADAIADALRTDNRRLRKLYLSGNKIKEAGVEGIAAMLRENGSLELLALARNEINVRGGVLLAEALKTNTTLHSLHLASNLLASSLPAFGEALTLNNTLLELDLEKNSITEQHAFDFGHRLVDLTLMTLNISNNRLGDRGIKPILDSIKEQASLRYLDLSNTGLTKASMDELAHVLRLCPMLETLQVDDNRIGCEGVCTLAAQIKGGQSLTSLNMHNCGMDTTAAVALALAFHSNPSFTTVVLSHNEISDEGCRSLCYALKRMTLLTTVDLAGNRITAACLEELSAIFVNNAQLKEITLAGNPIAAGLANGVLSRRTALRTLEQMPDSASVLAEPRPPAPRALPAPPKSLPSLASAKASALSSPNTSRPASALSSLPATPAAHLSRVRSPPLSSNALVQVALSASSNLGSSESRHLKLLQHATKLAQEEEERQNGTYPPLIPAKDSLEHPLYPGFGRGRFSNACHVQPPGDVVPYTVVNSQGPRPAQNWNPHTSTSGTLFGTALRRRHKVSPYSERQLENNIGGLLITPTQIRNAFRELDVDGSGFISKQEFEALYETFENFGVQTTPQEVDAVLRRYKMWDDGKITEDEFAVLMLAVAQR